MFLKLIADPVWVSADRLGGVALIRLGGPNVMQEFEDSVSSLLQLLESM